MTVRNATVPRVNASTGAEVTPPVRRCDAAEFNGCHGSGHIECVQHRRSSAVEFSGLVSNSGDVPHSGSVLTVRPGDGVGLLSGSVSRWDGAVVVVWN